MVNCGNLPQFEASFCDRFWSYERQQEARHQIERGVYNPSQDGSMAAHFERLLTLAWCLTPRYSDGALFDALVAHFPEHVISSLRTAADLSQDYSPNSTLIRLRGLEHAFANARLHRRSNQTVNRASTPSTSHSRTDAGRHVDPLGRTQ